MPSAFFPTTCTSYNVYAVRPLIVKEFEVKGDDVSSTYAPEVSEDNLLDTTYSVELGSTVQLTVS